MNGLIGFVIGGFKFAVGAVSGVWLVMEAAVGQGSTEAFVEEQEQKSYREALAGETVAVARTIAL